MPAKIFFESVDGPIKGKRFRFDEQMLCIIGRTEACQIALTDDAAVGVSRHHCMLDLRPPNAFLRDLGSRNGTWLNGKNIGHEANDPGKPLVSYQLASGDKIRFGNNVFQVTLVSAVKCHVCRRELPDDYMPDGTPSEELICRECRAQGLSKPVSPASKTVLFPICRNCGTLVEYCDDQGLCIRCTSMSDPSKTVRVLTENEAHSNLLPLPGYRVLKQLGRGGMGAVYLAQDVNTLEKLAVKLLLPDVAVHDECRRDFLREAENLKPLKHPNIVGLRDCIYTGGAFCLIMEYCAHGTLHEFMKRRGHPFDLSMSLDLLFQILDALDYAHNVRFEQETIDFHKITVSGLVHRDIKPENVFLSPENGALSAKIADFGIAKAFDMAGISGCTRTGDFSGTLSYIPKQQFLNYKYVKPEVDVWAAAATFYYMVSGCPPRDFSCGDIIDIFNSLPYPVQELCPEISPRLASVINGALDDRKVLRYKTAAAFKIAIQDAIS